MKVTHDGEGAERWWTVEVMEPTSQRLRITASRPTWAWGAIHRLAGEARTKALEDARAVDQGRDPRDRSRVPTFEQAAERVIRLYEPTWRAGGAD